MTRLIRRLHIWFPLSLLLVTVAGAEETEARTVFQGVTYTHCIETEPPRHIYVLRIGLDAEGVRFTTTGPNGDAPRETDTETTRAFVARAGAQAGVNGSFFIHDHKPHTDVRGLAVSNGTPYSRWDKKGYRIGVNIAKDNSVTFFERAEKLETGFETEPPVDLYNALTGNTWLVRGGKNVGKAGGKRHPRTAIGLTEDGELLLLVVDGRQPGRSVGMTYAELGKTLVELGAAAGINLDGGGSSTMVLADPEPRVVNAPVPFELTEGLTQDPPGIERAVGNNIGVFAEARAAE